MMHVTTNQYYTNVSECHDSIRNTAPSAQIDTGKICKRIERPEKFPPRDSNAYHCDICGNTACTKSSALDCGGLHFLLIHSVRGDNWREMFY